jgi:elongation factor P
MAILSYSEIKPGKVIIFNDEPWLVLSYHVFRKQMRKPVNNTKIKNLKNGRVIEQTFHAKETIEEADLEKKTVVFIFKKGDEFWFHTAGDKSDRFPLSAELVGDAGKYIKNNAELSALVFDEEIIGVTIPIKVELKVTEAMDAVKGNTSNSAQKEVTLETGATLMVPMFINTGDTIAINTELGEYSERVAKA